MAPVDDAWDADVMLELFACGICDDIMLEATTLGCCGRSFCRGCLLRWIRTSVHSAGVPRCPGGCSRKMPVRLPAIDRTLRQAIEQLAPEKLKERRRQEEEDIREDANQDICHGGLRAWQEVAASRDIIFANQVGVRQGTPGIIIGNFADDRHVTVRFDEREDGSDLCVNVLPEALMAPLPGGFRLGQRVVALFDLLLEGKIGVCLGTSGVVVGRFNEERLIVLFDERQDAGQGTVSVSHREVVPQRPLVGGFKISQKIQSAMDLVVDNRVVVPAGTPGIVLAEFSDTRLTVSFGHDGEYGYSCFNVLPVEIKPCCELPVDLPEGPVQATKDLVNMNSAIIEGGTRGDEAGADETQAEGL